MSTTFDIYGAFRGRGLKGKGPAALLLAGALLAGPAVLVAEEGAGSGEEVSEQQVTRGQRIWQRISERHDQNQDGQVTADEVPADRFSRMDRNGDGVVTAADFEDFEGRAGRKGRQGPGHRGKGMAKVVAAADADQDGKVTQAEWSTFVGGIDADGDGLLTEDELTAHREAHRKAMGKERPEGLERQHARRHTRVFMDTDEDGQLETEDLLAVFSKLDRNGDGELSEADRPVRHGKRARHRFRGHRIAGHLMRQADINADEQLTQSEWTGYLATLDSNTDGLLSREELDAARPEDAPERPNHADRGEPKPLEVARLTEMFTRRDADANGVIEGDEWSRRGPRGHRGHRGRGPVGDEGSSL